MTNRVKCIMLVDDNKIDNFFHERVIKKCDAAETIIAKESAHDALEYLTACEAIPDIIFLDVNMPGMNGWDFLAEYKKLDLTHECLVVVMISDFNDPDDEALEATKGIFSDFRPKPLTKEILEEVIKKYSSGEKTS
ncbi:hypothetical protein HYN59_10295 [Flavobacterium album]|uniref:Response regulatory domain-containing protein n=1 Tax=Flavobacterium album TaxID=2175091 RepID=A0A2S1QYJ6_9FLAO|nr:response regulator [Flavobacterium album]AWH85483.1 hypothetical protein HYN59_10295 [Flavobacterium album]